MHEFQCPKCGVIATDAHLLKIHLCKENDPVQPDHYRKGIQPIEVMEKTFTREQYEGFLAGNVLKYIMRYPHKNGVEDLKKARQYLDYLIEAKKKPLS